MHPYYIFEFILWNLIFHSNRQILAPFVWTFFLITFLIKFKKENNNIKEEFEKKGNKSAIKKIDKILKAFDEFSLEEIPAATVVTKAKEAINKY